MPSISITPEFRTCGLWQTCLLSYATALVLSFCLSVAADSIALQLGIVMLDPPSRSATFSEFFGAIFFAPLFETLLVGLTIQVLSKYFHRPFLIAGISAMIFGGAHGLVAVSWFFGTVCSFFAYSYAYVYWSSQSLRKAYVAACVPHMLINLTAMTLVCLG
ncbi:CPBP family intramembrane metalloprotease [Massilia sp. CCM 8695]|uniref:CPBP family intramembrane metalloprotease n=1 Tax=Massilia frigida TaxID=2609281 RepID=A0ABX0NDM8_9BURK|nr:CPBP family glutamic-type intramembrane protease [Massilia frigida]NHZ83214.1 CPBP family intramembrane metalloprotease [Massilia frigida]